MCAMDATRRTAMRYAASRCAQFITSKLWSIALTCALICAATLAPTARAQSFPGAGFVKLNTTPVTGLTFTDSACQLITGCYYAVLAVDSSGAESAPATCAANQLCSNGNVLVVIMPSSGIHTVLVSWIASTSTVVGYNVYVHRGPLPASSATATVQ